MNFRSLRALSLPMLLLSGCATAVAPSGTEDRFFANLSSLCGRAFAGRVVTTDPADRDLAGQRLVMHVRACSHGEIRIPFHVGADRSRTWVISRTASGLRLKHDHRHEDGSADVRTQYGGDSIPPGTARRQSFPADAHSRALFVRENIPASVGNIWSVEIVPGHVFAYGLARPGRSLRVEFDLTQPVAPPPPPWGAR